MTALYDLKELLCRQLEDYGKKGEMSAAVLERVDMLAHAVKNLDKILENYDSEYSGSRSYADRSYADRNYADHSMARRRDSMGRFASDGYSRHGNLVGQLRDMMNNADDDWTRQELQRLISKME